MPKGQLSAAAKRTVKLGGNPYVLAMANGSPAYASGSRYLQQIPSDEFEITYDDWSGGLGVDYESCQNFITTIKGRLVPRPTTFSLTPPVKPAYEYRWSFEAQDSNGRWYKYLIGPKAMLKVDLTASTLVIRQMYTPAGRFANTNDFFGEPIRAIDSGNVYWFIPVNNGDRIAYIAAVVADETAVAVAYAGNPTLTSDITAGATSLTYTCAGDPFVVDDMITIGADTEIMYVSAIDTLNNILTIVRAQQGTTAAAHTAGGEIKKKAGDTITVSSAVVKGGAQFKQLSSGKIARATSSHSAGAFQSRAEVSLLAAGASFLTDTNWGGDFAVDEQTKWITDLEVYGDYIVAGKQDGYYVATVLSDNTLNWQPIAKASSGGYVTALGQEKAFGGCVWHGYLWLGMPDRLVRSTITRARSMSPSSLYHIPYSLTMVTPTAGARWPSAEGMAEDWLHTPAIQSSDSQLFLMAAREMEDGLQWHPYYAKLGSNAAVGAIFPQFNGLYGGAQILWVENQVPTLRYMPLDTGFSFSSDGVATYGEASLTANLFTKPETFPCNVLLRELRLTINNGASTAAWSAQTYRDSFSTAGEAFGASLTATGSLFPTPQANDTCRWLRLRFSCAMAGNFVPNYIHVTPTLIRAVLHATYLPDAGEDITFSIDVDATAQLQRKSHAAVVTALQALVKSGAVAWVDYLENSGYVDVVEMRRQPFVTNAALTSDKYVHLKVSLLEYS